MIEEEKVKQLAAKLLGDLTLAAEPQSIEDCRAVAKLLLGTCMASIALNIGVAAAMEDLAEVLRRLGGDMGVSMGVEVQERPVCSPLKH